MTRIFRMSSHYEMVDFVGGLDDKIHYPQLYCGLLNLQLYCGSDFAKEMKRKREEVIQNSG